MVGLDYRQWYYGGMETIDRITVWNSHPELNRLDPESPLARDVLGLDPFPPILGWGLDNHYITRPKRRQPNAFERAHALAKHGRHI